MSKKKNEEFEGMGALGKAAEGGDEASPESDSVAESSEESHEETSDSSESQEQTEESEEEKPHKKKHHDDEHGLREELEREREKSRSLAEIIEKVSNMHEEDDEKQTVDVESKMKDAENRMKNQMQDQMKDVHSAITAMGTKMEELAKAEKPEKMGSKVKDMIDNVQAETSKKMADLQDEIKKLVERMDQPRKEEEVSKGLSVFGGRVDIKNDLLEMRSGVKDVEKSVRELKDEMDTRITRIKEQIKILERFPTFEEKLEGLIERMGPGNIEKLKKFIFSADEITGEIIPNEIEKKLGKELTPVFEDIKSVKDGIEKAAENIKRLFDEVNYFKTEIKTLYKFGDYISDLQTKKDRLDDKLKEKEANLISLVNKLEAVLQKKADTINDRIDKFDKAFTAKLEAKTKDYFDDMTEEKILEIEDRTEKHLAVSRAKVNDMFSKFVQFQNVVNPTLTLMKEGIEKANDRVEKIKVNQAEFQKELQERAKDMFTAISGPRLKDMGTDIAKFTKGTNDRFEDFEAEFVQFQNVINPTLTLLKNEMAKMDAKLEKLKTRHEDLKGNVSELAEMRKSLNSLAEWTKAIELRQKDMDKRLLAAGSKLDETLNEFNTIVKQTFADRKKFEEENRHQRDKINILLKELKSE